MASKCNFVPGYRLTGPRGTRTVLLFEGWRLAFAIRLWWKEEVLIRWLERGMALH